MNEFDLPPELRELEDALASRPGGAAADSTRKRILAGVRAELAAARNHRTRFYGWHSAAALAAAILLWMNLSLSAAGNTNPGFSDTNLANATISIEELRDVLPELSEADARECLRLQRTHVQLICAPDLKPVAIHERNQAWFTD